MRRTITYRFIVFTLLLSVLNGFFMRASTTAENGDEFEIKALFILNFIKYTEWPRTKDKIVIGVVGDTEIKDALIRMVEKKYGKDKKIDISNLDPEETRECDMIIVASSEAKYLETVSKRYQGKGVLIVGDECKNAAKGAAINLLNLDNRIRFDIYQTQAKVGGVKISSRLSELAHTVHP